MKDVWPRVQPRTPIAKRVYDHIISPRSGPSRNASRRPSRPALGTRRRSSARRSRSNPPFRRSPPAAPGRTCTPPRPRRFAAATTPEAPARESPGEKFKFAASRTASHDARVFQQRPRGGETPPTPTRSSAPPRGTLLLAPGGAPPVYAGGVLGVAHLFQVRARVVAHADRAA